MKKLSFIFFISVLCSHLAFGACEEERRKRDRAKQLLEDWANKSELGATVGGIIVGGIAALCGAPPKELPCYVIGGGVACGGSAGLIAKRFDDLYKYREEALRICEENEKIKAAAEEEKRKEEVISERVDDMADRLTRLFRNRMDYFTQLASSEIDSKINEYIDNDEDLTDPDVRARLDAEIEAIGKKYF